MAADTKSYSFEEVRDYLRGLVGRWASVTISGAMAVEGPFREAQLRAGLGEWNEHWWFAVGNERSGFFLQRAEFEGAFIDLVDPRHDALFIRFFHHPTVAVEEPRLQGLAGGLPI